MPELKNSPRTSSFLGTREIRAYLGAAVLPMDSLSHEADRAPKGVYLRPLHRFLDEVRDGPDACGRAGGSKERAPLFPELDYPGRNIVGEDRDHAQSEDFEDLPDGRRGPSEDDVAPQLLRGVQREEQRTEARAGDERGLLKIDHESHHAAAEKAFDRCF